MTDTLTRASLADYLAGELNKTRTESENLVQVFFEEIARCLEAGYQVKLSGFGNFVLLDKKARPGRNPKTGVFVMISPRRVVAFHAGQKLKKFIASSLEGKTAADLESGQD